MHHESRRLARVCLSAALLATSGASPAEGAPPLFDASGYWRLEMSTPRLVAGECGVADDEGYQAVAKVSQDGDHFSIAIGEEPVEQGTVQGSTYTHGSQHTGRDPSGLRFTVTARSVLRLESASSAAGETALDLDYADGAHCVFQVAIRGERLPGKPGGP